MRHADGSGDKDPHVLALSSLYDELTTADQEHGDVAVTHESGWTMSAHRDGRLVFENLADTTSSEIFHMIPVPKGRVLALWKRLIEGDIEGLLKEPWKPGYVEKKG